MKPGAEAARKLDRRQQRLPAGGLIIKSMTTRIFLYM
jgi:hypothetical protein